MRSYITPILPRRAVTDWEVGPLPSATGDAPRGLRNTWPIRLWNRLVLPASHDLREIEVVLKLTAIILLLRPFDVWWVSPFVLVTAGLSLLFPTVRRRPITWWLLSTLIALRVVAVWPLSDNHVYLLAYWCLAIGIALAGPVPSVMLARSSRWLLGAAFACAVLWKAFLSPDYRDERFFRVTLMTDDRFAEAVMLIGGLTADQIRENRAVLEPLPEGAALDRPRGLIEPPRLRAFATVATWGGLALEGLLGALYLLPIRWIPDLARHTALMLFCVTTYALAPVAGFGWLIATMGLAQCPSDGRTVRAAYVVVFFLVLLYSEIPWTGVLASWMR